MNILIIIYASISEVWSVPINRSLSELSTGFLVIAKDASSADGLTDNATADTFISDIPSVDVSADLMDSVFRAAAILASDAAISNAAKLDVWADGRPANDIAECRPVVDEADGRPEDGRDDGRPATAALYHDVVGPLRSCA